MLYSDKKTLDDYKKVNTSDWNSVKNHLRLRIINTKYLLKEYPKDIMSKKFLDISQVLSLQEKQNDMISHMITKEDLNKYNVSFKEAYAIAKNNTIMDKKRRILTLKEFMMHNEVLYPLMSYNNKHTETGFKTKDGSMASIDEVDEDTQVENILVLCNRTEVFGGAYMCIPEITSEVYNRFHKENFYILPMSVHCLWCIRQGYVTHNNTKPIFEAEDDMLCMVEKFNDEYNKDWLDVLSYKIYYYSGDDGKAIFPIQ